MSDASVDQATAVRGFFRDLSERGYEPSLHNTTGSYELRVDQIGRWCLTVAAGSLTVSEEPAQCETVLEFSAADFLDIVEGRRDLVAGYLRGTVRASGDLALALGLRRLLPVRP
jgi:predicted lipid carrier protein YhbT